MLASTKVLTAGPLLGAVPLVVTVNGVGVPSEPVQLAVPVTLPAVLRGEGDGALAGGVGVRPGRRAGPGRGGVDGAVGVGQGHIDVGPGEGHEAGPVTEVLRTGSR